MATKRSSTKKSATKKSAKKSSKKTGIIIPPPNLRCIEACVTQFEACVSKGVDRATCMKRLQRCLQKCFTG